MKELKRISKPTSSIKVMRRAFLQDATCIEIMDIQGIVESELKDGKDRE